MTGGAERLLESPDYVTDVVLKITTTLTSATQMQDEVTKDEGRPDA